MDVGAETWCGLISCSHPACWGAQRRIRRGQKSRSPASSGVSTARSSELPTQKVHNILNEAFGSQQSLDSGFDSPVPVEPQPERANPLLEYLKARRRHTSQPQPPQASPSDGVRPGGRRMQLLEVQEVFDLAELRPDDWQNHFSARPYYVWFPNPHKRRDVVPSLQTESAPVVPLPTRDVTEELLPRDPSNDKRSAESQKRPLKSSYSARVSRFFRSARQQQANGVILPDSVLSLLDLPPPILSDVLDQIEKGELMTKERLDDLVRQATAVQRPETGFLPGQDLLQQRRAKLHLDSRERNVRQPGRHQSRAVFQLDGEVSETISRARPLPPIAPDRSPSVQCVSVDVPAPAPSVSHSRNASSRTRPFAYTRDSMLDLMLAPIASPVQTQRTETPRTDNDSASVHVAASTDRSTLANDPLPVPSAQTLPTRSATSSRREVSAGSSGDIPAGAVPPSTTPKTAPAANKEDIGALGTIPETEDSEPPPRTATVGRVTFEEGVVAVSPQRSEPEPEEAPVSPSESGHWTQQASPDLWPIDLPQPVSAAGELDRPQSSSSTPITIPVAVRQAKSAPARPAGPPEPAPDDETPLPPPPSPEPLPATQSLEPAERADSLRVHSGGAAGMSPITESSECGEEEEEEEEEEEVTGREDDPTPIVSTIAESARTAGDGQDK